MSHGPGRLCWHWNFARAVQLVSWVAREDHLTERHMNGLIYVIGLIVVILFILSLFGLR
jgi:hypothetical protein